MRRSGRVVTRNTIVNGVWGLEQEVEGNTLDVYVRMLRSKVDKDFNPKLIQTVRGFGYSVCEELKS
jgi:DNA-binding response OmpR family regulator